MHISWDIVQTFIKQAAARIGSKIPATGNWSPSDPYISCFRGSESLAEVTFRSVDVLRRGELVPKPKTALCRSDKSSGGDGESRLKTGLFQVNDVRTKYLRICEPRDKMGTNHFFLILGRAKGVGFETLSGADRGQLSKWGPKNRRCAWEKRQPANTLYAMWTNMNSLIIRSKWNSCVHRPEANTLFPFN